MNQVLVALLLLFLSCGPVFAGAIILKNGKTITGDIIEQNNQMVKIKSRGVTLTYYRDEIENVDGEKKESPKTIQRPPASEAKPIEKEFSTTTAKRDLILEFITASGAKDDMSEMFDQLVLQVRPQNASKLRELLNVDEIILRLVPIYAKYFTEDEVRKLVEFHKSEVGQKLRRIKPSIVQDSMNVTVKYFEEKAQSLTP